MNNEKDKYYEKTVDLILSVFKVLRNDTHFSKRGELSDRKRNILVKAYGPAFSDENLLFSGKFILFAPSFVASRKALHSCSLETYVAPKNILSFDSIKEIRYELMPCQTTIRITRTNGSTMKLYDGVPRGETYASAKAYAHSVQTGAYKEYTICLLSCIYALTAMRRCKPAECESTYKIIEKNVKQLVADQQDTENAEKKYGCFPSFDFVHCDYDPKIVEKGLDHIEFVMEELEMHREEDAAERKEQFARTLERKMDEARQQYEKQNR